MSSSETRQRPRTVTSIAWTLFCGAAGATFLVLAVYALRMYMGEIRFGLPLDMLLLLIAIALATVPAGRAFLRGRPWAWIVVSLEAIAVIAGAGWLWWSAAVTGSLESVPPLMSGSDAAYYILLAAAALASAVAVPVAVLLQAPGVRGFFGITAWRGAAVAGVQLAVLAAVVAGAASLTEGRRSDAATTRLQMLGEGAASSDEDVAFMLDRLARGGTEERISAAWALGRSGRVDALQAVLDAARNDTDSDVRVNAIEATARLGGELVQEALVGFLDDSDPQVRAAALRGIAKSPFPAAAPAVGRLLAGNDAGLSGMAADVLGRIGDPDGVPGLLAAASHEEEDVRSRVAFALGRIGDPAAVPVLVRLLEDERWEVRANAAQALGMIGEESARPALQQLRGDPNEQVRAVAESALEKLG